MSELSNERLAELLNIAEKADAAEKFNNAGPPIPYSTYAAAVGAFRNEFDAGRCAALVREVIAWRKKQDDQDTYDAVGNIRGD